MITKDILGLNGHIEIHKNKESTAKDSLLPATDWLKFNTGKYSHHRLVHIKGSTIMFPWSLITASNGKRSTSGEEMQLYMIYR